MSRVWTWRQAIFESDLQATTKLVLQALASHLNDMGGPMFPSQERLAKLCSLSERSVITHLQIAEDEGWIVASKREKQGSKWAANEYAARFPDGVKHVHPTDRNGVKEVHPRGEGDSCGGVKEVHTNSPSEPSREHTPHTPRGAGDWESDSLFMKLCEAYATHNASRVDFGKAWEVWSQQGLAEHADALLMALVEFSRLDQWRKEGGKFIPRLSKWLADGSWRSHSKISKVVTEEELAARAKVVKAGQDAWARMETAKRMGWEPEPDDIEAFQAWQAVVKQI